MTVFYTTYNAFSNTQESRTPKQEIYQCLSHTKCSSWRPYFPVQNSWYQSSTLNTVLIIRIIIVIVPPQ